MAECQPQSLTLCDPSLSLLRFSYDCCLMYLLRLKTRFGKPLTHSCRYHQRRMARPSLWASVRCDAYHRSFYRKWLINVHTPLMLFRRHGHAQCLDQNADEEFDSSSICRCRSASVGDTLTRSEEGGRSVAIMKCCGDQRNDRRLAPLSSLAKCSAGKILPRLSFP